MTPEMLAKALTQALEEMDGKDAEIVKRILDSIPKPKKEYDA